MSKIDPKPTPAPTAEDLILEEAQRMARSVQKPGLTKEQNKLIAQGIAKGIELYKKQQSAKARERDKSRKRAQKLRQAEAKITMEPGCDEAEEAAGLAFRGGVAALGTAGALFAAMAAIHLARVVAGWTLILGPWTLPPSISLAVAALSAGFSAWFFQQAMALR